MKKTILSFVCFLFVGITFSQITTSKELKEKGFNTPPNISFAKIDPAMSHADKLNHISDAQPLNYVEPLFVGKTWDEFFTNPELSQEDKIYYSEAKKYFESLSPKVKTLFSVEELWHTYYFDVELKNKLKTIK
jgi:hypothetical protein